jgi:hypothetical protein
MFTETEMDDPESEILTAAGQQSAVMSTDSMPYQQQQRVARQPEVPRQQQQWAADEVNNVAAVQQVAHTTSSGCFLKILSDHFFFLEVRKL